VFPDGLVGYIENNIQKKFGLSDMVRFCIQELINKTHCYICLGLNINEEFSMDSTQFGKVVSAENVTVAIKGLGSTTMKWKAPFSMAGSSVPVFESSGQSTRRSVPFHYRKNLQEGETDTSLGDIITNTEFSRLVVKWNRAYHEALKEVRLQIFQPVTNRLVLEKLVETFCLAN
jgi:hypothetical protein